MSQRKLVRDRIPEIIRASGREPVIEVATGAAFGQLLRAKLQEEVSEFLGSGAPEELADILEVLHALAREAGMTPESLEELRRTKAEERGGFNEGYLWTGNRD